MGALLVGEDHVDGRPNALAVVHQRCQLARQPLLHRRLLARRGRQLRGAPLNQLKHASHGALRLAQRRQRGVLGALQRRLALQGGVLEGQRQLLLAIQALKVRGGLVARRALQPQRLLRGRGSAAVMVRGVIGCLRSALSNSPQPQPLLTSSSFECSCSKASAASALFFSAAVSPASAPVLLATAASCSFA